MVDSPRPLAEPQLRKFGKPVVYKYQKHNPKIETEAQWSARTRQWKTAYHESGHAWLATRLGWRVLRVTLDPQVDGKRVGSGLTEVYVPTLAPRLAVLMNYRVGRVCERLVLPRKLWGIWEMGGGLEDDAGASEYLDLVHDVTSSRQQTKLLREAKAEVCALVSNPMYRSEIDRLAKALMESITLTGDQVRAIIEGHDF